MDVAVDGFGAMIVGGVMSAMITGVAELAAVQFLHWQHFFAAFSEIVLVSMVTKKGKNCGQCLQTKGLTGQCLDRVLTELQRAED